MNIEQVEFVVSAARLEDFPRDRLREIALVGRSNVGKSRLINALVRQPVARTSSTPGKTRLVNFYRVRPTRDRAFYLVDLPGFGYTDSRAARGAFEAITRTYFERAREAGSRLAAVLLIVDSRHPGMASDLAADGWLGTLGVQRLVVATKCDKLSRAERSRTLTALEQAFQGPVLPVSAATGENLDELWRQILPCVNPTPPR